MKYVKINVNPKGRKTGDCSTRAIAGTLGISWEEALQLQTEEALKCYYDPTSKQVVERVLARFGWIKMKQPRWPEGNKVKVRELDEYLHLCCNEKYLKNSILVTVAHHHTCIKDGVIQDTWDCGSKSIGNYYVLGE